MTKPGVYKWSAIDRVGNALLTFGGNVVLARLLDPSDFGLLAMVAIFVAIAYNISSCGMSDGLIHKIKPSEKDYSTVFCFNSSIGFLFGVLFIALSSPIAHLFGHPQLKGIMIAIGICIFFQTMTFVQETKLRKELDMKSIAIVKISATITSLIVGVVLIKQGYSYWGLVSTRIFLGFFQFAYYLIATRWIPKFRIYRESFREMFGYGFNLMLAYIISQVSRTLNATILGKFAPAAAAGNYSQAQKLEEVPFGITESIFNNPFFPLISNESDESVRCTMALNMHRTFLFTNITIGVILILVAKNGIEFLYGERWAEAIPIFKVLVIYGIINAMKYFYQTIFKVYELTSQIRNLNALELLIQGSLLLLLYDRSILLIASTQVIASLVVVSLYLCKFLHVQNIKFAEILKQIMHTALSPVLTFVICLPVCYLADRFLNNFVACICILACALIVLAASMYILDREQFYQIKEILYSKLKIK